jgi:hypothetical protein
VRDGFSILFDVSDIQMSSHDKKKAAAGLFFISPLAGAAMYQNAKNTEKAEAAKEKSKKNKK